MVEKDGNDRWIVRIGIRIGRKGRIEKDRKDGNDRGIVSIWV